MKIPLDEINEIIGRYGVEAITMEEIYDIMPSRLPVDMAEQAKQKESFRRLWQRITEEEAKAALDSDNVPNNVQAYIA